MNEKFVLLWSQSQNCFHIETVLDMLEADANAFRENRRMDYVPLVIGTENECDEMADKLRHVLRNRSRRTEAARAVIDAIK